jgi:predicted PurR-regulated permease PerM
MVENDNASNRDDAGSNSKNWRHTMPRWAGIGIFLLLAVFALAYAQLFFVPVVLAFMLSMVFSPVRRVFDRRGVPQGLTALGIVIGLLIVLAIIATALAVPVSGWVNNASQIEHKIEARFHDIAGPFSSFSEPRENWKR